MRLRAMAKINLGLDVLRKREDGYHEVRMIMQTIQMYDLLDMFRLHIVRSRNFQTEANSYVWDSVNGITINQPIDKFNHLWDAARYAVMEYLYWVCNRRK